MKRYLRPLLFGLVIGMLSFTSFATKGYASDTSSSEEGKLDVKGMIMHHILDAHEWHLYTTTNADGTEHHVSIPLPIILYSEKGLEVFSSSNFHNADHSYNGYTLEHEHIYYSETAHTENKKGPLDFSITKNVASMMLSALLLLLVFKAVSSGYEKNKGKAPKGIQSFFEPIIVYMRDEVIIPNIGEHKYKKYLPYLLTLFFFIWFNNLLGLLPTGANTSGNIAFTLTLAFLTLLMTVFSGNGNYWTHIFAMPGVPWPMYIILTPVELMGIIIKPVALMIRLFANISAGHTIILSLISLIFISKSVIVGGPVSLFVFALTLLELFVALLQAYIFTMLTALFIGQAVEEHDHH